ncbi:hypothetical protein Q3G72_005837 [Acer saccharum]|nr:hypothetical protein Q3G72_005837 [Acer saccharum]
MSSISTTTNAIPIRASSTLTSTTSKTSGKELRKEEKEKSEAKEEEEGHERIPISFVSFLVTQTVTQTMTQDRTEALLAEPDPNFFPNHDETITSRIIETVHMVKEIPPFRDKREVDEESNKEKKTFIDEIHNEKKENTFEVDDMGKVP